MSKATLPFNITLQSGKGKNKEVTKAEICQQCYDATCSRIESEFEFNNDFSQKTRSGALSPAIEITKGESIVPSNVDNIKPPPQPKCLHDRKSILEDDGEKTYLKCNECGEEWEA